MYTCPHVLGLYYGGLTAGPGEAASGVTGSWDNVPGEGGGFVEGGGIGCAEVKCIWGHGQSGHTEWV